MVLLRGFGDKLGSARVEGQACGPGEALGAWVLLSHQCFIPREKRLQKKGIPHSFLLQGKGPCWGEVPTVIASILVSHGALPREGPTSSFTSQFQMGI